MSDEQKVRGTIEAVVMPEEQPKFKEYPCLDCGGYVATYFAVNNIPTHGHVCTRCFNKLKPEQVKQFYTRRPL